MELFVIRIEERGRRFNFFLHKRGTDQNWLN